jgi:hypothetical protein
MKIEKLMKKSVTSLALHKQTPKREGETPITQHMLDEQEQYKLEVQAIKRFYKELHE